MKKILSLILLSLSLTGWGAENLSKVFSSELAETKAAENNVTMINSMELSGSPYTAGAHARSIELQRMLVSKEFKEFSKANKVTVKNIYRTVTYDDVVKLKAEARENAREILGVNAPLTESHWRGMMSNSPPNGGWHKMSRKAQDAWVKKQMSKPLPQHYLQQAWRVVYSKDKAKRKVLWKVFNGQVPVSLLLDSEGNVLNKKVFKRGLKVEDYIKEYKEILDPEEEDEEKEDSKVKEKVAK